MAGGIEEDAEVLSRLFGCLARADVDHGRLGGVEVVDDDIEVHLLRMVLPGPAGSVVVLDLLDADRRPGIRCDLRPGAVLVDVDRPVEELSVELRELSGVGRIEHDNGLLCDSHDGSLRRADSRLKGSAGKGSAASPVSGVPAVRTDQCDEGTEGAADSDEERHPDDDRLDDQDECVLEEVREDIHQCECHDADDEEESR